MKLLTLFCIVSAFFSCAKRELDCYTLPIFNASFEKGDPGPSKVAEEWSNTAVFPNTPPDLHSNLVEVQPWSVNARAKDGNQFVALVVRADGTREAIFQTLRIPVYDVVNLQFSLWVNMSPTFLDTTSRQTIVKDFVKPTKLEVSIIDMEDEEHILHKTDKIDTRTWQEVRFETDYCGSIKAVKFSPNFATGAKDYAHVLIDDIRVEYCIE